MQLILQPEPAGELKKKMSTLEESLVRSQISATNSNLEEDVCSLNKSSSGKTVMTVADTKQSSEIILNNDQLENFINDINNISKTNDNLMLHNAPSSIAASCQLTNDVACEVSLTGVNRNPEEFVVNAEIVVTKNEENININNIENKSAELILGEDITDNVNSKSSSALLQDLHAGFCTENVTEADQPQCIENKNVEIAIDDKFVGSNESSFIPDSDTNEKCVALSVLKQTDDEYTGAKKDKQIPPFLLENDNISAQKSNQILNEATTTKPSSPITIEEDDANAIVTLNMQKHDTDATQEKEQENIVDSDHNQNNEIYVSENCNEKIKSLNEDDVSQSQHLEKEILTSNIDEKIGTCGEPLSNKLEKDSASELPVDQQSVENDEQNSIENHKNPISTQITQKHKLDNAENEILLPLVETDIIIENNIIKLDKKTPTTVNNAESSESPNTEKHLSEDKPNKQIEDIMDVDETSLVSSSEIPDNAISEKKKCETQLFEKNVVMENFDNKSNKTDIAKESETLKLSHDSELILNYQNDSDQTVMEVDDVEIIKENNDNISDTAVENDLVNKIGTEIDKTDTENESHNFNLVANDSKNDKVISPTVGEKNPTVEKQSKLSNEVGIIEEEEEEDIRIVEETSKKEEEKEKLTEKTDKMVPVVCKLSNAMDILSEDEDDPCHPVKNKINAEIVNKCINIDDDDDIMFIEDAEESKVENMKSESKSDKIESHISNENKNTDSCENHISPTKIEDVSPKINDKGHLKNPEIVKLLQVDDTKPLEPSENEANTAIVPKTLLKSVTKNLAEMTRNELEDFCILKLVESVVEKSNLNEIKNKMKTLIHTYEDLKKRALLLTKQNRDLQVVIKTVQENQKKINPPPMLPMKITRSVGMQVILSGPENNTYTNLMVKKKLTPPVPAAVTTPTKSVRNVQNSKAQKPAGNNIPVPRLVPASSPNTKNTASINTAVKPVALVRTPPARLPEKRPHSKLSPASSVTVDLTDDEPPAKLVPKNPAPPVRLVPSQNLMPVKQRPQLNPTGTSHRKVYIPISGSQSQGIRPGPGVVKNFNPTPVPRAKVPARVQHAARMSAVNRHPAPLPDAMKQYQPPMWKALPPAPDLKLSKVDNGIVISWKFEGYQTDTYEEVASFQLYAYQETPAPPSTALWKKIGDIKALPLPMACTLTQFMSGFKYYFAVRAIDVRNRIGPFSLPGSIMLISKS